MFGSGTITRRSSSVHSGIKLVHQIMFFQVIVVIANIINEGFTGQFQDTGGGPVDEITVVGHIEDSPRSPPLKSLIRLNTSSPVKRKAASTLRMRVLFKSG